MRVPRAIVLVCGGAALTAALVGWSVGSALDPHKLPLGDGKYLTSAKKGYVYSCQTEFRGGGAHANGPWIHESTKTWDLTKKIAVQGSVTWKSVFSARVVGSKRVLAGNGLPPHKTGVYPVQATDPAFNYDRNPNSIRSYTLRAALPADPKLTGKATCVGGTIGVMKTGIPLYSAFDAGGRDAAAHEVQDVCDAHPQMSGQYHYHSLSACVGDVGSKKSHSPLIGWALDGFGIYGQRGENGEQMATAKLDACHGHTHTIVWNGKRVRMYHYHATLDFPYVVGCYRGTPITSSTGLGIGGPP